jgi:hypothetical protein
MAWIEPCNNGHRAVWRDKNGKKEKGPTLSTKEEALSWAIANGHHEQPKARLTELLDDFCNSCVADGRIQKTYAEDLRQRLPSLFNARKWITADQVTRSEIDRWWRETKGLGVRRPLAQVLSLLRWAFEARDLEVSAKVLTYKFPRQHRKVKDTELLTLDQVAKIHEAGAGYHATSGERGRPSKFWPGLPAHLVALLHYLSTYGARPSTACRHTIRQINFARGTLRLSAKRSGEWEHPLREDTLKYFAAICQGREKNLDAPLFLNHNRTGWKLTRAGEADQLSQWYKKHITGRIEIGAPLRGIYVLKDYALTTMRRNGMTPEEISKFSGHLTPEVIDENYIKAGQEQLRADLKLLPPGLPPVAPRK